MVRPDEAIVQQRVLLHPAFQPIAYKGIPDVRVVLFRNEPAMAGSARRKEDHHSEDAARGCGFATDRIRIQQVVRNPKLVVEILSRWREPLTG